MSDGPDGGGGDFDGFDGDHHSLADGMEHHAFDEGDHDHAFADHGHGHGFHGFDHGFQSDVVSDLMAGFAFGHGHGHGHGFTAGVSGEIAGRGRRVFLPGLAIQPRVVQALQWPHGGVSAKDARCLVNPRMKLRALLEKAGLVDVGYTLRDVAASDEVQRKLMDTTPFDERVGNTPMPCGWYPNATGHTRLWKDFYMLGKRWSLIGPRVADPADIENGVYLAIAGATWYFDQTMDYETRIAINIKARTKWNSDVMAWESLLPSVEKHRQAAVKVCEQLLEWFKCFPVSETSCAARLRVQSVPAPVQIDRIVPPPSTVPRELFKAANSRPAGAAGADGIDAQSFPG